MGGIFVGIVASWTVIVILKFPSLHLLANSEKSCSKFSGPASIIERKRHHSGFDCVPIDSFNDSRTPTVSFQPVSFRCVAPNMVIDMVSVEPTDGNIIDGE